MQRLFVFLALLLATLSKSNDSAAQTDAAAAELLFQKGRTAMVAQDFDQACQLFEESFALDAAVGTVMNLATCEEKRGRLTSSWERWQQAVRLLEQDDSRRPFAQQQLASLSERMARLTIQLKEGTPRGVSVRRDGVKLGKASLGEEFPVDPGAHLVVVGGPSGGKKSYSVTLRPGESKVLEVGLDSAGKPRAAPATGLRSRKTRALVGYAALGVGLIGVGGAVATGILLPQQQDRVDQNCPDRQCNDAGVQAAVRGQTMLGLNTASWIVAGASLAAGSVLLLTLPQKRAPSERNARVPTLRLGVAASSVQLRGSF